MRLVASALRLSAHVLADHPGQLPSQLTGRLAGQPDPQLRDLLQRTRSWPATPWLRPLTASLTPPGGPLQRILAGHDGPVCAVAVSADGRRAVSGGDDGTVRVWDLDTGEPLHTLAGHARRGARGGGQRRRPPRRLRRRTTGRCGSGTWTPGHCCRPALPATTARCARWRSAPTAAAPSPAAATGRCGSGTWTPAQPLAHPDRPRRPGARGGGQRRRPPRRLRRRRRDGAGLGPGHRGTAAAPWPATTAGCARWRSAPTAAAPSPAATTGRCGSGTWTPASSCTPCTGHDGWVHAVAVSADGRRAVSGGDDGTVRVWDLDTGQPQRTR